LSVEEYPEEDLFDDDEDDVEGEEVQESEND
jgi:hypothetical protein